MVATYGQTRLRLKQQFPEAPIELLDGWIMDRYQALLDQLPWTRIEANVTIQAPNEVNAGTVTVEIGSNVVFGAGTAWTPAQTGCYFRLPGDDAYFSFTYVSPVQGTLDRAYDGFFGGQLEGASPPPPVTPTAGLDYQLDQAIYQMPPSVRLISGVRDLDNDYDLDFISQAQLNASAPSRSDYGDAKYWSSYMDSETTPPVMQIELYPIPMELTGYSVKVTAEDVNYGPGQTSVAALPFVRPAALNSGVAADVRLWQEKFTAAEGHEALFKARMQEMIRTESFRIGATRIEMAEHISRHRSDRLRRGTSWTGWLGGQGPGA